MLDACVNLYSYLAFQYHINPDSLLGHRDYMANRTCPGDSGYATLVYIRNRVRQNLSFGAPYIANPLPQPFSTDVETNTELSFHIKDDVEGVDFNSIKVWVNYELITPTQINGDLNDYCVRYEPTSPFEKSKKITITTIAADFSTPPESLSYSYNFNTETFDLYTETYNLDSLINGTIVLEGNWNSITNDVYLEDLTDGEMIKAVDVLSNHRARIYPDISESGNYLIFMAFAESEIGSNAHYRLTNSNGLSNDEYVEYNQRYTNVWGKLGNGPVYFEAGSPSSGYIELLPVPNLSSTMMIDAFHFEKQNVFLSPAIPELKYIRINEAGDLEVAWFPVIEGDIKGYRLFQSSDGRSWGDPIVDESILITVDSLYTKTAPAMDQSVFFRIVAVDTNDIDQDGGLPELILSEPSDTYGFCSKGGKRILIVDNFDRQASWSKGQHFFVRSYGEALTLNGLGFESCVNDAVQTGEVDLKNYDIVIYFCGDDATSDEGVAYVEQAKISDYLTSGGKLFISGSEIDYDLGRYGQLDLPFYNQFLKANYLGDDTGICSCAGAPGTIFEDLTFNFGEIPEDTYIEDWPDFIQSYGGSEPALFYQNSTKVAAIQYTGKFSDTGEIGQLVYFAFTYETIYPAQSRADVINRILNYFGVETSVSQKEITYLPTTYSLMQNYPNPFNPTTVIRYELPENSNVTLTIFNILGQKVVTLEQVKKEAGSHQVIWDGMNAFGEPVSSGVYFYELKAKYFVAKKKMILVQ